MEFEEDKTKKKSQKRFAVISRLSIGLKVVAEKYAKVLYFAKQLSLKNSL